MDWTDWPLLRPEDIGRIIYFAREEAGKHKAGWSAAALVWLLAVGAVLGAVVLGLAPAVVIATSVLGSAAALGVLAFQIGASLYTRLHILCDLVIPLADIHDERVREAIREVSERIADSRT